MHIKKNNFDRFFTGCAIFCLTLCAMLTPPIITSCIIVAITACMVYEMIRMHQKKGLFFYSLIVWYPIVPASIMFLMHASDTYRPLFWFVILATFCFDTASYCAGKLYSYWYTSTKIAPSISPQKSWQGAIGGFIATTFFINIIFSSLFIEQLFLYSLIFSSTALVGDLFESYIKRNAGVKDSGTLLASHGGFLDRFDAILATMTLSFFFKDYLMTILF
jgi:phosphatidate cytidylyltransferase